MRLFLAINVPSELRTAVWRAAEPLREGLASGVSWVREESLHVTVRFLGEQPDDLPARLVDALAPGLARCAPPELRIATVGAFPSMRRPRVLWIGGESNSALAELYHEVERVCVGLGFERESRAFRPHLTLGRVRQRERVDAEALARAADTVRFAATFVAPTIDLMESELGPAGARYRLVAAVPVGARG